VVILVLAALLLNIGARDGLDHRHGAGLDRAHDALPPCPLPKPR
jgi:hypothetical protein